MGTLFDSIVDSAKPSTRKEPTLKQDKYGFYYFSDLPSRARLIADEETNNLLQLLSPGKYFLLESGISSNLVLHRVKPGDNVQKLTKYIPTKQLYLYTP